MHFSRYTLTGALGTTAHYATMTVLLSLIDVPALASGIGAAVGAIVNHTLCRHWVFTTGHYIARVSLWRFAITALLCMLINIVIVGLFYRWIGVWTAQLLATAATLFLGFHINRRWTFGLPTRYCS